MSLQLVSQCPICNGTQFIDVITCKDFTCSGEEFTIQRCAQCQLHLTNPRPDTENIGKYYQSDEYISHTGQSQNFFDSLYLWVRRFTLRWKQDIVEKRIKDRTLLDFGCGTGEFLHHMEGQGWEVTGVEPSPKARVKALTLINKESAIVETLHAVPNKKFNAITLWHVLEHVPDLMGTLTKLKSHLHENGLIFVAVPNKDSADAKHYKQFWAAYDVPRHLWHFSQSTMQQLLTKSGFEVVETLPMKLDAFYVSLLSEHYKHGNRKRPAQAFLRGLRSNAKARRSTNYSSLIYIARHA